MKELKRWLETSPFDLALEDRRMELIEALGIELGSPEYDRIQGTLDGIYERARVSSRGTVSFSESFDFAGRGKKCGAGYISSSYTCRIDSDFYGMSKAGTLKDEINRAIDDFEKEIKRYSPQAQEQWRETLLNAVTRTNKDKRIDDVKREKNYLRATKNAIILAKDGPPTKIMMKDGEEVPVSHYIYPFLSGSGNMMWKDPIQNVAFTKRFEGQMELEQNRVTAAAALASGQVKAAIDYYNLYKNSKAMQAKGEFGSVAFAKLRDVDDKEVESFWSGLSPELKEKVALSGVDSVGNRVDTKNFLDPRSAHKGYYEQFPEELEWRGRQVVKAYLSQTAAPGEKAISPWTGLPVELPGIRGRGQGVVDHVIPISRYYPQDWTGANGQQWSKEQGSKTVRQGDISTNIVIGESGLNNKRGKSEDWDRLIKNWTLHQKDWEKHLVETERLPSFMVSASAKTAQPSSSTGVNGPKPVKYTKIQKIATKRIQTKNAKAIIKSEKPEAKTPVSEENKAKRIEALNTLLDRAKKDRNTALIRQMEAEIAKLNK